MDTLTTSRDSKTSEKIWSKGAAADRAFRLSTTANTHRGSRVCQACGGIMYKSKGKYICPSLFRGA